MWRCSIEKKIVHNPRHLHGNSQTQPMPVLCTLFFDVFIPLLLPIADIFSERIGILPTTLLTNPVGYRVLLETLIVGHLVKKCTLQTARFITILKKACLVFIPLYFVFTLYKIRENNAREIL
jgi:hypothetical protein